MGQGGERGQRQVGDLRRPVGSGSQAGGAAVAKGSPGRHAAPGGHARGQFSPQSRPTQPAQIARSRRAGAVCRRCATLAAGREQFPVVRASGLRTVRIQPTRSARPWRCLDSPSALPQPPTQARLSGHRCVAGRRVAGINRRRSGPARTAAGRGGWRQPGARPGPAQRLAAGQRADGACR